MLKGKLTVDKNRRYDIKETCALLDMSRKTLRKYTLAGEIHLVLHEPSGKQFYEGAEIERFYKATI